MAPLSTWLEARDLAPLTKHLGQAHNQATHGRRKGGQGLAQRTAGKAERAQRREGIARAKEKADSARASVEARAGQSAGKSIDDMGASLAREVAHHAGQRDLTAAAKRAGIDGDSLKQLQAHARENKDWLHGHLNSFQPVSSTTYASVADHDKLVAALDAGDKAAAREMILAGGVSHTNWTPAHRDDARPNPIQPGKVAVHLGGVPTQAGVKPGDNGGYATDLPKGAEVELSRLKVTHRGKVVDLLGDGERHTVSVGPKDDPKPAAAPPQAAAAPSLRDEGRRGTTSRATQAPQPQPAPQPASPRGPANLLERAGMANTKRRRGPDGAIQHHHESAPLYATNTGYGWQVRSGVTGQDLKVAGVRTLTEAKQFMQAAAGLPWGKVRGDGRTLNDWNTGQRRHLSNLIAQTTEGKSMASAMRSSPAANSGAIREVEQARAARRQQLADLRSRRSG